MKAFFTSSAVSSSSGSAEQPAIINSLAGSSAEQPVCETAQPVKALRSITDVQWWLKNNEVVLSSSAEAVRIREVVEALSTKPKTIKGEKGNNAQPGRVQDVVETGIEEEWEHQEEGGSSIENLRGPTRGRERATENWRHLSKAMKIVAEYRRKKEAVNQLKEETIEDLKVAFTSGARQTQKKRKTEEAIPSGSKKENGRIDDKEEEQENLQAKVCEQCQIFYGCKEEAQRGNAICYKCSNEKVAKEEATQAKQEERAKEAEELKARLDFHTKQYEEAKAQKLGKEEETSVRKEAPLEGEITEEGC